MSKKKKITISDIAKIAGVSKSTVSHVINQTKYVSKNTKEKVQKIIDETGFIINFNAQSLKKSETRTIGLVISDIKNQFFIEVIHAIHEEARRNNYKVILGISNESENLESEIIKTFHERRVDGIIFSPSAESKFHTVPFLQEVNIPTVLIDRKLDVPFDWVGIENIEATKLLVNHLIDLGHKRIGLVAGLRGINTTEERIIGYKEALLNKNIPFDKDLIVIGESKSIPAEQKVTKMFKEINPRPSAFVVANNLMVLGTMRALRRMNIKIPDELALVSFDDFEGADLFRPGLTSIVQPCTTIGSKAVKLLIKRIKKQSSEYREVSLTPQLIIRESCGYRKNI